MVMKVLFLVAALLGAPPELVVTLGRDPAAPGGLTVQSTDRGTDDLAILKEGEWSVGQLALSAASASQESPALVVRLKGAAAKAPSPVLVRRGPVPLPDGGTFTQESYITTTRRDGDDVVATIPYPPVALVADRYDLVDLTHSVEWAPDPVLEEDPKDKAPLGGRRALILIHGKENADLSGNGHAPSKIEVFKTLRESAKYDALRAAYKPYFFKHPTYRSTKENGEALARLVAAKLPGPGAGRVALVSHSMGGQVMRHAAAAMPRRVGLQISFAGAHHGSIMSSLLYANDRIVEKIGPVWWLVLKVGQRGEPDTPGLRSLCWDNHDGIVSPREIREMGVRVNPELAAFNAADQNLGKLVCLHGDISNLSGKGPIFGVAEEVLRRGAAAFHPVFGNIDPVVPFGSGVLEGSSRHQVHTYPELDHMEVITKPEPWNDAIGYLEQLASGQRVTQAPASPRAR